MTQNEQMNQDLLRIKGQDIQTELRNIEHRKLRFWSENPRIYSIVHAGGSTPTQDEIYDRLKDMEHVRELVADIKDNGGLIDPIIVRGGSMEVLEGNSRLAAYRYLAKNDPIKWERIRCRILPEDTAQSLVFALLGQYHVKGKKDWAPYEKAGFVYRRHKQQNVAISDIASELGMTAHEAQRLVNVFQFMIDHGETETDRWSYYEEYHKSQKISRARQDFPEMDSFIVKEIQSKSITRAADLRDNLPIICGNKKLLKKYLDGKKSFEEAAEEAKYQGGDTNALNRLKRFRNWISSTRPSDFARYNRAVRQKIEFELKQIDRNFKSIKSALEKKSSEID